MLEAYRDLSTCRAVGGMGVGPIPYTAIQSYADRFEYGELFVRQIMQIDRVVVAKAFKSLEKKDGNAKQ